MAQKYQPEYDAARAEAQERWTENERERARRQRDPGVPSTLPGRPPYPFGQPPEDFASDYVERNPIPPGASWGAISVAPSSSTPPSPTPRSPVSLPGLRPLPEHIATKVATEMIARPLRVGSVPTLVSREPTAAPRIPVRASEPAPTPEPARPAPVAPHASPIPDGTVPAYREEKRACGRNLVLETLERTGGNKAAAARALGISREGLYGALGESPYYRARRAAGRA